MSTSGARPVDAAEDEPLGLLIVCCLAALAGAVDACGISLLKDLYVSFMSGNTTSFGAALARQDWTRCRLIAGILVSFVGGAAAGTVIAHRAGRYHLPVVTLTVAAILTLPLFAPAVTVPALTVAMGALNAAMQRAGPIATVSVTYVTGTLVKFGQNIGHLLCGAPPGRAMLEQIVPWAGLLAGAVLASAGLAAFGRITFDALPAAATLIGAACLLAMRIRRVSG